MCETMEQEQLLNRLAALAEKFLSIAESSSNTTTASRALDVFEKARTIGGSVAKQIRSDNYHTDFFNTITEPVNRSQLFRLYDGYCKVVGEKAFNKQAFFQLAIQHGFQFREYSGNVRAYPPKSPPRLLQDPQSSRAELPLRN